MRQNQLDTIKQALGSTDDEFAALQPKVEKLLDAQQAAGVGIGGRGGGRGRRGGGGGGGAAPATPLNAVQQAMADLRATLDDQNATPEAIKAKLDALRAAKDKALADFKAAQADLKSVLTQRQEAQMVLLSYLD
jgi:Spy/CpxP family protein refolding chaperone